MSVAMSGSVCVCVCVKVCKRRFNHRGPLLKLAQANLSTGMVSKRGFNHRGSFLKLVQAFVSVGKDSKRRFNHRVPLEGVLNLSFCVISSLVASGVMVSSTARIVPHSSSISSASKVSKLCSFSCKQIKIQ